MIAKVRKPTQEVINERNRREKLYEYYGIPYNVFDSEEDKEIVERNYMNITVYHTMYLIVKRIKK